MASITIRKLDDRVKARLRLRAARHGRSMEEEAREILTAAASEKIEQPRNLAEAIHRRFARLGGVELELPPRTPVRKPPDFSD
ncbi:MAG TPA: plasmid stabilization protein [Alphaproteobacteria bacterium]|jgi:plasmid stability protein|nr:plasmid stabilization protein [Alphaproteobacteria bacterium]